MNDKSLLESMHISTSPLTLNGKTISTGTEEEYNTEQGIKMKRTYTVADKSKIEVRLGEDYQEDGDLVTIPEEADLRTVM